MSKLNFPVFPDATGGGQRTRGGEYGVIRFVTNLNNSGAGSFRDAVTDVGAAQHSSAMILFRTSGRIALDRIPSGTGSDYLWIWSNKTILGASSPEGITLSGLRIGFRFQNGGTGGLVMNHIASRPGAENPPSVTDPYRYTETIGLWATNLTDFYMANCSFSWATDEILSPYFVLDGTVEYCTIAEALNNAAYDREARFGHSKGIHGYGSIIGGKNFSLNHNLYAHATQRFMMFNGLHLLGDYSPQPTDKVGLVDYRWNTLYNWSFRAGAGGAGHDWNVIDNSYIPGPATIGSGNWGTTWDMTSNRGIARNFIRPSKVNESEAFGKFYLRGNWMEGAPASWETDNWLGCTTPTGVVVPSDWRASTEHSLSSWFYPTTSKSRLAAHLEVMAKAGMFTFDNDLKDPIDERIKANVNGRTYTTPSGTISPNSGLGIIDRIENVGGWRTSYPGTEPQVFDGDAPDFLPVWFVTKYGIDTSRDYISEGSPAEKPWQFIFFENPANSIGVNYTTLPSGYDWQNTIHHRVHKVVVMHRTGQINFLENTVETFTLIVNSTEGGTTNTIGGVFQANDSISLQASAASGFRFSKWQIKNTITDLFEDLPLPTRNPYPFIMPSTNTTVRAVFEPFTPPPSTGTRVFRIPS